MLFKGIRRYKDTIFFFFFLSVKNIERLPGIKWVLKGNFRRK